MEYKKGFHSCYLQSTGLSRKEEEDEKVNFLSL